MAILTPQLDVSQLTESKPNSDKILFIKPKSWELNMTPNTMATATVDVTYGMNTETLKKPFSLINVEFKA